MSRTRETTSLGQLATAMPRGTRLVYGDGGLCAIVDRGGVAHARLRWRGDALERLIVGEAGAWTIVGGEQVPHPLFGGAHPVWVTADEDDDVRSRPPTTWMGVVGWWCPEGIPPILAPGRLGAGAGTMILNVIAVLAAIGGVDRLVYAGPYPTAALWRSLQQSFFAYGAATDDDFTADAIGRALRGDMTPVGIAFVPDPFERVRVSARVVVQLRDGLERVAIDGVSYDRGGGARRLVAIDGRWAAELWLGERAWGHVAELDDDGEVVAGPTALPRVAEVGAALATMIGQALPPAMCAALADVVAELVAAPLAEAARAELSSARVQWGDPGAADVIDRDGVLILHAGLWAHLAPHGLAAVARGLALALTAPIAARAQARLAASLATS